MLVGDGCRRRMDPGSGDGIGLGHRRTADPGRRGLDRSDLRHLRAPVTGFHPAFVIADIVAVFISPSGDSMQVAH